ncbi:FHA domain-containing protein [Georgenia soli]|uniref:FHA domain-containing protein n=1 Tax=Georgenia soli TaxID=638953 RepID=A0A2A9ER94_9MICO|nr:FHA domain-containing protein [Georgenia soli]PFG41273.1 FHA domain-containing protein [Georgenia soli]
MNVHEYRAGRWIAIVGEGAVALLHPEIGAAAARDLWRLTRSGSRLGTWVEHLAGRGIRTLPSFAMVEAHPSGLSVLVRGELTVQVGDQQVSGAGYTTWREAVLPGAEGFTITASHDVGPTAQEWLPVAGGIVLASAVRSPVEQLDAARDNHAGLHLAQDTDEDEDLEITLMQAPALAAVIGRPAGAAQVPPGSPTAPLAGGPATVAGRIAPEVGDQVEPAVAEKVDPETAERIDPEVAERIDPEVAERIDPEAAERIDPEVAEEVDPSEDAEYDHLFWSTEQLDAEEAERRSAELAADPATPSQAAPSSQPVDAPSSGDGERPATPTLGLEATQVPEDEDDFPAPTSEDAREDVSSSFAPPVADHVPGAPVHPVRWEPPAPATGGGLISEVPWARPADEGDHDGHTVLPSQLPALPHDDAPAATGDDAQAWEEAPVLELVLSTGPRIEVTRPVLLGRAPESSRFRGGEVPRLVTVANPQRDVSGTHVEIRPAGDHVVVTDMNSTNGTVLVLPGQPSFRLHPGTGVPVPPGGVVELGTGVSITVVRAGEDAE